MKGETAIFMRILTDAGGPLPYTQFRDAWCAATAQPPSTFASKIWTAKKMGYIVQVGHGPTSTLRIAADAPPRRAPADRAPAAPRLALAHERIRTALMERAQRAYWSSRCQSRHVREIVRGAELAMCEPLADVSIDYEVEPMDRRTRGPGQANPADARHVHRMRLPRGGV